MEAILDRGAVEMDDFVEVRTFGLPDMPAVARFAGRPYDDCDNSHVEDFARRGREALLDLRRRYDDAVGGVGRAGGQRVARRPGHESESRWAIRRCRRSTTPRTRAGDKRWRASASTSPAADAPQRHGD